MTIGLFHLVAALVAIASGGVVLARRKGTRAHRALGWTFAASMLAMNGSALFITRLTGRWGPFHVAAVVSLATLAVGVLSMRLGAPERRVERHYYWMTWSYVGLLAAAVSETLTRLPRAPFWWMVLAGTLLVVFLGKRLITRGATTTLAPWLPTRP